MAQFPPLVACALLALLVCASAEYQVSWTRNITVKSFDGTHLRADALIPHPQKEGEKFPLILFPNSWGVPQIEYVIEGLRFGKRGFVILEYETRGWFFSGGQIGCAGPNDQKDFSSVLDYALAQAGWNIDPTRVAACGISYGAGLSLLGGARDARVKTIVALSGWGSILDALYDNSSPSLVWGDLLMLSGKIFGRESKELEEVYGYTMSGKNISYVKEWAAERSAETYVSAINSRKVPVLLSNNYEDRIFKPNHALKFFQQLQVPKMLLLNQGIHAQAELGGLFGQYYNFPWQKVSLWMDHWLLGIDNGIMDEPLVQCQLRNDFDVRVTFPTWPFEDMASTQLQLGARSKGHYGTLLPASATSSSGSGATDTIVNGLLTGLSAGVPVLGDVFQTTAHVPILVEIPLASRKHAIVYLTDPVPERTRLCGTANLTLDISADSAAYQVYAYLYSVDALGVGTFLTVAPWSSWSENPNTTPAEVQFASVCVDVPARHRIALGIDMRCALFKPPTTAAVAVTIAYGQSVLSLPVMQE